jgi:adenylyltransferase/sulfurtransferase
MSTATNHNEKIKELTAAQVNECLQAARGVALLDVREPAEYDYVRLENAKLLTGDLASEIMESWDKNTEIICYCHHGIRSYQAACFLAEKGFTKVANLVGGIDAWSLTVDPSVPRY